MIAPRVSVILLSYNSWEATLECLDSFSRVTYPNLKLLAIDNGSTNPPLDQARAICPDLTIIENGKNLGYAEGNNVGLRCAIAQDADYVMVQNNDTVVAPDFLTYLVQAAEAEPRAALIGPMVYYFDEPQVIQSAGGGARGWRFFHRGINEIDQGQYPQIECVAWLTGCAILARISALKQFGLFDPDYFLYEEELDWCLRARRAGWQILFVPQAHVWHKGVQRNYAPSPLVTYYSTRNELLLLKKQHAGFLALTAAILRHLRTITSYSLRPRWRSRRLHRDAHARALFDFCRGRFGAATFSVH